MSRRSRSLLSVVAALVAGAAFAATSAPAAGKCSKPGKEASGCTLPKNTSYQMTRGENDEMNLTTYSSPGQFDLRSSCVQFRSKRFKFKAKPKVGKTYTFTDTQTETSELSDGITVTYTYKIDLKVKINSAMKATTTGTASATAPAVPAQGSFAGEDAYNSTCKLNRTLKRVLGD